MQRCNYRETRYRHAVEWKWLKRYRAWRASRKQFLYPENYLEPELRDDKEESKPPPPPAKADKDG